MTRILVTDVDRTLTDAELRIPSTTRARLGELRQAGILVVIASGRSIEQLREMQLDGEADALVAENGAVVQVSPDHAPEPCDPRFAPLARSALAETAGRFAWRRVIGSGPRALASEASERLERGGVAHALSFNADEVMLLPPGVDKATGVERALAARGARLEDAWAIGDGENDATMLGRARVSAAPQNAHAEARAAASAVTLRAFDAGFLEFTQLLLRDGP